MTLAPPVSRASCCGLTACVVADQVFESMNSPADVWTWAHNYLLPGLYTAGPSDLVIGTVQVRQARVRVDSCG